MRTEKSGKAFLHGSSTFLLHPSNPLLKNSPQKAAENLLFPKIFKILEICCVSANLWKVERAADFDFVLWKKSDQ